MPGCNGARSACTTRYEGPIDEHVMERSVAMPAGKNTPVLIGPVPLVYVQSMTISEGYRIERIAFSRFSQAVAPTTKTITIEAILTGKTRMLVKKALEAMALSSRALVAATAPVLKL